MTLKGQVKKIFSQEPCFFEWGADDTQAISQGSAVLQCKTEHTATLACMMPPNNEQIVKYNTNLLILLTACAGWLNSESWLASCFRQSKRRSGRYQTRKGAVSFDLIVDKVNMLTTLHCEEH